MPEGPEIYALCLALKNLVSCRCVGKHLLVTVSSKNNVEDWSFGLNGRVHLDDKGNLVKLSSGYIPGEAKPYDPKLLEKLGPDWCTLTVEQSVAIVEKWSKSKKKLGSLLIDQSEIAGIGVAWGSEILAEAGLKPDLGASSQLTNSDIKARLANALMDTRDRALTCYTEYVNLVEDKVAFVNSWFDNLYKVRQMVVYKKGTRVEVAGSKWWLRTGL